MSKHTCLQRSSLSYLDKWTLISTELARDRTPHTHTTAEPEFCKLADCILSQFQYACAKSLAVDVASPHSATTNKMKQTPSRYRPQLHGISNVNRLLVALTCPRGSPRASTQHLRAEGLFAPTADWLTRRKEAWLWLKVDRRNACANTAYASRLRAPLL